MRKAGLATKAAATSLFKREWPGPKLRYQVLPNRSVHHFFSTFYSYLSYTRLFFSSLAAASVMYQCRPKECDIQLSAADEVSCTLPHHRTRCCNKLPPAWNLNLLELLFLMFPFLYWGFWARGLFSSSVKWVISNTLVNRSLGGSGGSLNVRGHQTEGL